MNFKTNLTRRATMAMIAGVIALSQTSAAYADGETVRLLRAPVGAFHGVIIAEELGLFEKHGLNVEIELGGPEEQNIGQLMAGRADVVMAGIMGIGSAVANGLPVVAVMNTQNQNFDTRTVGLLVKADSPIQTIEDLAGMKIGVLGTTSHLATSVLITLEAHGLTADDVTLVNLPFDALVDSLERGVVDAAMPVSLFYELAVKGDFREFPEAFMPLEGTPAIFFATTREYADANQDVLERLRAALTEAYEYANANPEAVRQVDRDYTRLPEEFIAHRAIAPMDITFSIENWDKMYEALAGYGFLSRQPTQDEYLWEHALTE